MGTVSSLFAELPELVPLAALAHARLAVRGEGVLGAGQLQAEVLVLAPQGGQRRRVGRRTPGGSGQQAEPIKEINVSFLNVLT